MTVKGKVQGCRRSPSALLLVLLLLPRPVQAQDRFRTAPHETLILLGGALVGAGGLLATAGLEPLDAADLAGLDASRVNGLDRFATRISSETANGLSDMFAGVCSIVPAFLFMGPVTRDEAFPLLLMWGETLLWTNGITSLSKGLSGRLRPMAYNADFTDAERTGTGVRDSFFSRHTSTAFASSVFFAHVWDLYHPGSAAHAWVWRGAIGAAAATGVFRVMAGRHYPTDVLAGAAVGSAAALLVVGAHRAGTSGPSLSPVGPRGSAGFTLRLAVGR